jgi:single stranded DNA-binding protein
VATAQLWSPEIDGTKGEKKMYRNHVELIGFTGSDAETKTTPSGKTVTTFSIAIKKSYINKDRDRQERTEWHRVQAWGRLGEYAAAFKKGVEGELRSREYCTRVCVASKPSSDASSNRAWTI